MTSRKEMETGSAFAIALAAVGIFIAYTVIVLQTIKSNLPPDQIKQTIFSAGLVAFFIAIFAFWYIVEISKNPS
jgi:hypothetical protein